MISDGDSAARNAFRVALLTPHAQETPLPLVGTQELDPADILEVREMAEIIARAEQIVVAPRSSRVLVQGLGNDDPPSSRSLRSPDSTDIFDALVRRRTDDTAGPATPAPPAVLTTLLGVGQPRLETQTPVPAAIIPLSALATAAAVLESQSQATAARAASALVLSLPVEAPSVRPGIEEDAFYTPGGRVRSLADVTLDGYRPEPTLLLRAAARRKSFTWLFVAALLPITVLAAIAIFGRGAEKPTPAEAATGATAGLEGKVGTTTLATATMPAAAAPGTEAEPKATKASSVPTFDVNSLPTANH